MFESNDEIPPGAALNPQHGRLVQNLLIKKVMLRLLEEQSDPLTYVEAFNQAYSAGGRKWQAFCDDNSDAIVSDPELCTMFIKTLWKLISSSEDWASEIHGGIVLPTGDASSQPIDEDPASSAASLRPIDLKYAFAFTCEKCGGENTVLCDTVDPDSSDEWDVPDGLSDWTLNEGCVGGFEEGPGVVACEHCGKRFRTCFFEG